MTAAETFAEELDDMERSALNLGFVRGLATAAYLAAQAGLEDFSYKLARLSAAHHALAAIDELDVRAAAAQARMGCEEVRVEG